MRIYKRTKMPFFSWLQKLLFRKKQDVLKLQWQKAMLEQQLDQMKKR